MKTLQCMQAMAMPAQLSATKISPSDKDVRAILAWRVRNLRVANGWSQEELAHRAGLDRTYISALERKIWNVSLGNIDKIATALQVPAWSLLYWSSTPDDGAA